MSGPTWLPPKCSSNLPESSPAPVLGTPSVSASTIYREQQRLEPTSSALKSKQNLYVRNGNLNAGGPVQYTAPLPGLESQTSAEGSGSFQPLSTMSAEHRYPSGSGAREERSPMSWSQAQPQVPHEMQTRPVEKPVNRPSSIDAEIDSLTSMLADMENNSPFQPRPRQNYDSSVAPGMTPYPSQPANIPPKQLPAYKPMAEPPVSMAAKAPGQPEAFSSSRPVAYGSASHPPAYSTSAHPGFYNTASAPQAAAYTPASAPRPYPQPVAASYTTASTSTGPTFNVQVKVAQPVPSYTQPGRQAEQAYGPPPPRQVSPPYFQQHPEPAYRAPQHRYPELSYASVPEPPQASPNWYPPAHFGGSPSLPDTSYGPEGMYGNARKPEHSLYGGGSKLAGQPYQPPANKKGSYSEELPPPPPPPPPTTTSHHLKAPCRPPAGGQAQVSRPEEELDQITKKLVHDMNNPPTEEYFGRCARCGENVVGDGTGCIAMDQVFHVECFTCLTCCCRLRGQPFYAIDKKSYCESCYINTLEQCSVCSKAIMDRILRAMGRAYHPQCFTCVVCHRCLDGIPFTVDATSQIHCIEDFHMKFAPRCSVCAKPIMPEAGQEETVRIVALDRSFHVNCYKCEDCGFILSSEGEGCGCYPLDGHILCKTCSSRRIQDLSAKITTDC
ncbi:lipoma-preferred partner homolog isoform X2 [Rhincodon typus]|nr:lipoma-preferred partner homolog isoform X2 [Rhincodon typus]XP_020378043.1 lipoma-preferred partner homolog isoform X2 [Rhincodon typus]XP_048476197.1 lipoma-preferred partner homolog isoform X2 [Rhincodon typus]